MLQQQQHTGQFYRATVAGKQASCLDLGVGSNLGIRQILEGAWSPAPPSCRNATG